MKSRDSRAPAQNKDVVVWKCLFISMYWLVNLPLRRVSKGRRGRRTGHYKRGQKWVKSTHGFLVLLFIYVHGCNCLSQSVHSSAHSLVSAFSPRWKEAHWDRLSVVTPGETNKKKHTSRRPSDKHVLEWLCLVDVLAEFLGQRERCEVVSSSHADTKEA